ncbi:hypothetical protein ACWA06_15925 [Serratia rhizosphaerae]|uniref:DUF3592 domain-containing protein n=1 Tax=Serratia rubidaea TaxID=61652 RepID=A0ABS0MHF5_SERRU|nr:MULTISPECIES: hypothetical protein [Serratia]MBH1931799.1 hypothetical protein [Serratia rubidaea]QNK32533.1 hypothetical protein HF675_00200 [Serratia sp. JUb9]QPR64905.1 hypothetical protein I6G83_06560 [Serratia rubidaea]QPT12818.1 hypothetical protein I6G37_20500 [Serratia rubidaea]CAE1151612.1 conserved protein of unknown function [Serratia sp. Tan611]
MSFISEYASMAVWIVAIIIVFVSFKGIKVNKEGQEEIKNWSSQNLWNGDVASAKLVSWKQLQAKHNIDYFYSFTFECDLDGGTKKYNAAAVVKVSEASKLKKGLNLTIKYQGVPPKKIAVIGIDFE